MVGSIGNRSRYSRFVHNSQKSTLQFQHFSENEIQLKFLLAYSGGQEYYESVGNVSSNDSGSVFINNIFLKK